MEKACIISDCGKNVFRRGLCHMHYFRLRYHGSTDDPRRSWKERFWSYVDRSGDHWLWTGCVDHSGYGMLSGAPLRAAHRLSYLLAYGDPGTQHVLHHCDIPACVKPACLFLGDDADNHADMAQKKRSTWGERNARAKLSSADVQEIRRLLTVGATQRSIAERFAVSRQTIGDIKRRKSWYQLD